jgi:phage-related protein
MVNPKVNIVTAEYVIRGKMNILALVRGGRCLTREYLESLQESDRKKVLALLRTTAKAGSPPGNPEKFSKLETPIYEFKSYQDRFPCFFDGQGRILITHGFRKKKNRTPKEEISRALNLRASYLESKAPQEEPKR